MKTTISLQTLATGFFLAITLSVLTPQLHGQIFVVNQNDNTIRQFTTAGVGSVFVPASSNFLPYNGGIAFHSSGDLYVVNNGNHTIDKIAPNGNRSFFATLDPLSVAGIVFDNAGTDLYVSSYGNGNIFKFAPNGTRSTFASGLNTAPTGLAFDSTGNLYVSCQADNTIRKFDSNGNGTVFATASNGLNGPSGIVYRAGILYVANLNDNTIWSFDSSGNGTLFAGVASETTHGLNYPWGLAFDSTGNLYVSNQGDHTLWKFNLSGIGSVFVPSGTLVGPGFIASKPEPACAAADLEIHKYAGLTITGTVGCTYAIEWRPDNGNNTPWNPLTTITLPSSPHVYIDPTSFTANPGNRFYRAVLVQ
jgi:hypothetical protein